MKRSHLIALAAVAIAVVAGVLYFFEFRTMTEHDHASEAPGAHGTEAAPASVAMDELHAPGPVPDFALGEANAPVTVVEYASLTCSHCKTFHDETFGEVKKRYVDTGKVRFIYRNFPLDQFATAGALLAQCAGEGKFFPVIDAFFAKQNELRSATDPFVWLQDFSKQVGFTQQSFEACLSNQELTDNIMASRQKASEKFGVSSTPTFFFNGKVKRGSMTIEEFEKELEPLLK